MNTATFTKILSKRMLTIQIVTIVSLITLHSIWAYGQDDVGAIPKIEKEIILEVKTKGVGNRLVIQDFTPKLRGVDLSATISVVDKSVIIAFEFPGDQCLISMGGFTGFAAYSEREGITNKVTAPREELKYILFGFQNWIEHGGKTLGGNDSIHRFDGSIEIDGYRFVGEGGKPDRLTFALIENVGYVYLRGQGKVILKDGTEVILPKP